MMHDTTRMPKIISALKLAKAGFSIFPVKPNSKEPAIKGWPDEATSDPAKVGAWWKENEDYNIGIHTKGLLVVDLDVKDGGPETWRDLVESQEILGEAPPDTMTTRTPSGGLHHLFSLTPGTEVGNSVRTFGRGIDVRGRGGYVLGPGSSIGGKCYELISGKKKAMFAPAWVLGRTTAPKARTHSAGVRLNEETEKSVAEAEAWIARAPRPAEGERNNVAFRVAAEAFEYGIELDTGQDLMRQWNEDVGLGDDELETTVASAYRNRRNGLGGKNPDIGDKVFAEIDLGPGEPLIPPNPWDILDFDEAADRARIGRDPIIDGVLYASEISMMYGIYGTRKTMTAMDLVLHVTAGLEWCGRAVTKGAALWVAAEGGLGVYPRIDALRAHHKPGKIHFGVLERPLNMLSSKKDTDELIATIRRKEEKWRERLSLLVIDTLAAVSTGSDEGIAATSTVMANIRRIRQAIGPQLHILVIHHEGKTEGRGPRGTSALPSDIDTTLIVKKDTKTTGTLYLKKQRNGEDELELLRFEAKTVELEPDDKGRPVSGQVIVPRVTSAMDEVAERLKGTDDERVLAALDEMLEDREEEERIPGTANFSREFLDAAIEAANLTDRAGKVRTNLRTRDTADFRHVLRLLKRLSSGGHVCPQGEHEYFRGVSR